MPVFSCGIVLYRLPHGGGGRGNVNLAANLVFDQVCSQVFDKFVRVCDTLSTSFRLLLSKTWSRTVAGSLVHARTRQVEC